MSVEAAIVEMITESAAVTSLIDDRVYPNIIPEDEDLPAIAYTEISGHNTRQTNNSTTGLVRARFQLTIMNNKANGGYSDLCDIRDAIRDLCVATRNTSSYASVYIDHIEVSTIDMPSLEPSTTLYGKIIDMLIYYREV